MGTVSRLGDILFWFMVLAGAGLLVPCLVLPAWLEYRASLQLRALHEQCVLRLEAELIKLRKQREHLGIDDAYVLRLAHEQLNIETPGVVRIPLETGGLAESELAAAALPPVWPPEDELAPQLSAIVGELLGGYPLTGMFVWPETRPVLMLLGGGLILAAVVLIGAPASARPARRAAERC